MTTHPKAVKPTGEKAHFCPTCGADLREFEPQTKMLNTLVHLHRTKEYLFKLCKEVEHD